MVRAGIERVMVTLCPAVVDSQKAQIVFLEKFEASPCQPQVAETSGGKGKIPQESLSSWKSHAGERQHHLAPTPKPSPAPSGSALGGLLRIPGGFHSTLPNRGPPGAGAEPHLRRRSARSGWSSPCPGAPSSWIWCRRCEGQGRRGCQHPRGGSGAPSPSLGKGLGTTGDFSSQRSGF